MEQKAKSLKILKQRKMFIALPILVLPFITILFWVLGGGKMDASPLSSSPEQKGFNIKLPNANLKEGLSLDKMSYYDQAALDSAKLEDLIKKDPNYLTSSFVTDSTQYNYDTSIRKENSGLNTAVYRDGNEQKVHQKLEALQKAINTPMPSESENRNLSRYEKPNQSSIQSADVDRLEQMMQAMNNSDASKDPELEQLSGMLENILDIQHPERVKEKLKKTSEATRGQVFTIAAKIKDDNISSLQNIETKHSFYDSISKSNGFYSLDEINSTDRFQNAVEAVVHETQTIVNGSTVRLRLINDIEINGIKIPKNNFLFGIASLKGERLTIKINSIKYNNSLFPVDLTVYDMDGLIGIYIPGAINRDVAKSSADRSMQTLGITNLDDSWGAQAAGAGIEAAKSLLSKKVKLIKVSLKAGYHVLLFDDKQKKSN